MDFPKPQLRLRPKLRAEELSRALMREVVFASLRKLSSLIHDEDIGDLGFKRESGRVLLLELEFFRSLWTDLRNLLVLFSTVFSSYVFVC